MSLRIGDVVQLNSGGPRMTVSRIVGENGMEPGMTLMFRKNGFVPGDVVCDWFEKEQHHQQTFRLAALTPVEELVE